MPVQPSADLFRNQFEIKKFNDGKLDRKGWEAPVYLVSIAKINFHHLPVNVDVLFMFQYFYVNLIEKYALPSYT